MAGTTSQVAILIAFTCCFTIGICHIEQRGNQYHTSGSCRPVCSAHQTCVRYITATGRRVVTCAHIDPHRIKLEGTRIILNSHQHYNRQPQRPLIPLPPSYLTNDGIIPPVTVDSTDIYEGRSSQGALSPHLIPDVQTIRQMRDFPLQADTRILNQLERPDKIAIRERLQKAMMKSGVRPDFNSRLVNIKLHGVPIRKQEIVLPVESHVDVPAEQTPSQSPPVHKDIQNMSQQTRPNLGQTLSEAIRPSLKTSNGEVTCTPCGENVEVCSTGEHCYYSQSCGIMICQPL